MPETNTRITLMNDRIAAIENLPNAKGDLMVAIGDNTWSRLPVGADGQVLKANSAVAAGVNWAADATGGGSTGTLSVINVKTDYGAVGNGSTNDTTAVNNAIAAATSAGGGRIYFPPGTYQLNPATISSIGGNIYLEGAGVGATTLRKTTSNGALLKFYGTAAGNAGHAYFSGARGMTLDGNGFTGPCLDLVYFTRLVFYDIHCANNPDITIDTVELYDTRFYNVSCDDCGSATNPVVMIRCSRTASGFGSSSDSTNQLMFFGLLVETWKGGAIKIDPGTAGQIIQIYMFGMKIETTTVAGPAIRISGESYDIHMDDVWIFMGDFNAGTTTAKNGIEVYGDRTATIRGVHIANAGVATIASGMDLWQNNCSVDAIHGSYSTAPTVAHVSVSGGTDYSIGHLSTILGTLFTGNLTASPVLGRPIRAVAGVVSDSSFAKPPPVGTMAVDVTNSKLYVKTATSAGWKSVTVA